jgi:hypothetical protein
MIPDSQARLSESDESPLGTQEESGGVHYFFQITDGTTCFNDAEGQRCRSHIAAGTQAARIAAELAAEGDAYRGFAVRVLDDRGRELVRIPVSTRLAA